MPDPLPLLFFPEPVEIARRKLGGGGGSLRFPGRTRQGQRLGPRFQELQRVFEQQLVGVAADASGAAPEQVVVLETIGGVEKFRGAAERAGLEWHGEFDIEDIPPGQDFVDGARSDKALPRRLYLTIANQTAIQQLLALWKSWKTGGKSALPHGSKKWGDLFECLHDVRSWGPRERLEETGVLEDWSERVREGQETVRFQAELWFRDAQNVRDQIHSRVLHLLHQEGGRLIAECVIGDIHYHGVLAELPIQAIENFLQTRDADLVLAQEVMFFRPCAQGALRPAPEDSGATAARRERGLPEGEPVIALLDGLPIENHELLRDRLVVDDPEGLSASYAVRSREHGTAIASLIVHGDLGEDAPSLPTPLYVRPVMQAYELFDGSHREQIPSDQLAVDLVHQAVRRIFDADAGGVATGVRVINLSLGDLDYPFAGFLSPWARLLDWLSAKYGVLFVVSAGNHPDHVELAVSREAARLLSSAELQAATLTAIASGARHRAILAPAEGVNVLTVGAGHSDASNATPPSDVRELIEEDHLPAPYSRLGLGYRRGIKPDLLAPGGRGWYREVPGADGTAQYELVRGRQAAGLEHACPGPTATATSHSGRTVGTSNAAAICSRSLGFAYESLGPLLAAQPKGRVQHSHEALVLRALSVHTADWDGAEGHIGPIINGLVGSARAREHVSRFVGYGTLRPERMLRCTEQRATALGFALVGDGEAHEYRLPIPPGLGGYRGLKRLTATLAWFTPINPRHRAYKRAALWLDLPKHELLKIDVARSQGDAKAVRRGTIQHEVVEGERASVIGDDAELVISVNCRADAGALEQAVPYALICSLEVAEGVEIAVYDEIHQRLQTRVRATPTPGSVND